MKNKTKTIIEDIGAFAALVVSLVLILGIAVMLQ